MRKAELSSMTSAPASTATGASWRLMSPLTEMKAKSAPLKMSGVVASTWISAPFTLSRLPTDLGGRAQPQVAHGEVTLLHDTQEHLAHRARSAYNDDICLTQFLSSFQMPQPSEYGMVSLTYGEVNPRMPSRPTSNLRRFTTSLTASNTAGIKDSLLMVSWRRLNVWPSAPKTTS